MMASSCNSLFFALSCREKEREGKKEVFLEFVFGLLVFLTRIDKAIKIDRSRDVNKLSKLNFEKKNHDRKICEINLIITLFGFSDELFKVGEFLTNSVSQLDGVSFCFNIQ